MAKLLFKNYQVNLIDNGYLLNYQHVTQVAPNVQPEEQKGTRQFDTTDELDEFIAKIESPVLLADPKILVQ